MNIKKHTYEYVNNFIQSKGCELISTEYTNSKQKLKIKCKCGTIFERNFGDLKNKQMYYCTYCSGNKLNYDHVKNFIESKGCKLLSKEYINNSIKLDIQCKCGNVYKVSFNTFKKEKQYQCPSCGEKIRIQKMKDRKIGEFSFYTFEKVKEIIEKETNLKLLSTEYINCFEKLKFQCECGMIFYQSFTYVLNKIKKNKKVLCPKCTKRMTDDGFKLTEKEINNSILNRYGYQKYSIYDMNTYINNKENALFIHNECGHIFETSLSQIIHYRKLCPKCETKYSKGETKIMKYLEKNNISYETEKTFKDCKNKKLLPFDFYLNDYKVLIEFDGKQHFEAIDFFDGEKGLKETQFRDEIKNKYCKDNNIPLLRIPYNEINNIEIILDDFIDKQIPR